MDPDVSSGPKWTVHSDGSAVPNPGRMGIGAVLVAPDGTRHEISQASQHHGCNNEAELMALTTALQEAKRRGAKAVMLYCDNSVIVEQLVGMPTRRVARLAPELDMARQVIDAFDQLELRWIPRHRNGEADALARAALGLPSKSSDKPTRRRR